MNKEVSNSSYIHWVERLRMSDPKALDWFYTYYSRRLASHLLRLVKFPEVAEDLLHDSFIKLWEVRERIDLTQSFEAFLFRLVSNIVVDFYRKISRDKKHAAYIHFVQELSVENIIENLELKYRKELLLDALNELPPKCREVYELCKIQGKSYSEVSELLNISTHTISNHLSVANKKIQIYFSRIKNLKYILFIFFGS